MSIRRQHYLIYGLEFNEDFTKNHTRRNLGHENWSERTPTIKPAFLVDGMCGEYTYFGFITQLSNGWDEDEVSKEITMPFDKDIVISEFKRIYPNIKVVPEDIKLFFVLYWV